MFAFRAMNTDVRVSACGDEEAIANRVAATFAAAERRFSRFHEASELSALNRSEGPFVASPELFEMLERARAYQEMTDGLFDPGIGATLAALGYDRTFAPGVLDRRHPSAVPRVGRFSDVVLERETRTVWRPKHVLIDLGGMAKGNTVDRAAFHLPGSGAIDAGGDAILRGPAFDTGRWSVEIEDPLDATRAIATIAVSDAAVATSAGNRRRWRVNDRDVHHVIDPRTQTSSESDLLQATVIAPSAELADVLATTALLLGDELATRFLERRADVGAILVSRCGRRRFVGDVDVREVADA